MTGHSGDTPGQTHNATEHRRAVASHPPSGHYGPVKALVQVHPVTADRWPDLVGLFERPGPRGGTPMPATCWCMWWRQRTGDEIKNREAMRSLVRGGHEPGLLAYADGVAVGWVSAGRREGSANSRALRSTSLSTTIPMCSRSSASTSTRGGRHPVSAAHSWTPPSSGRETVGQPRSRRTRISNRTSWDGWRRSSGAASPERGWQGHVRSSGSRCSHTRTCAELPFSPSPATPRRLAEGRTQSAFGVTGPRRLLVTSNKAEGR